jgi:hypothetical protein
MNRRLLFSFAALCATFGATATLRVQDPVAPKAPAAPKIGDPLPTSRVNDHLGSAVVVGGKTGHWTVVAFFPKAATPG